MNAESTQRLGASEPDRNDRHEYHYEYDVYRFREGDAALVARSDTSEPHEVHFLRLEPTGKARMLERGDGFHCAFCFHPNASLNTRNQFPFIINSTSAAE